ncbi:hypothetical protein V8D89_002778 [Ganoderma adspersum]
MPSSRHPRARASARVREPTQQCQALLADEETHCSSRSQGLRGRYCPAHGREYGELTGAYKTASNRVDVLEPEVRKTRMDAGALATVAAVDAAVALANRYLDALGEEIDGRETHHKRFFQEVDENHGKWLKRRGGEQQGAVRLLERLRRRREEVVAVEDAARRSEEWRKSIAAKHAAAEAQRKASEEARRKVAQQCAGISTIEDQRRAVTELQRNAAAARSVLGTRTNTVGSTYSQRAPRVPPGYWPSVVPPRQPQPQPQPPRLEQHWSARETPPLLRPASIPRGAVFNPPANLNSWPVDVESQSHNAGRLPTHVYQTNFPVPNLSANDEDSTDCGCCRTLFWVAVLLFVFWYLLEGSRWAA